MGESQGSERSVSFPCRTYSSPYLACLRSSPATAVAADLFPLVPCSFSYRDRKRRRGDLPRLVRRYKRIRSSFASVTVFCAFEMVNILMDSQTSEVAQLIEVDMDVPPGVSGLGGNKICGGASCDFSDIRTSSKDAKERSASMRKLLMAVILCIIFMSVEVAGGIAANSLAILTDAAHLLSDVAAFAISLFSLWASGWEATPQQSYGFFRVEILGALVSIQLIWLLAGILHLACWKQQRNINVHSAYLHVLGDSIQSIGVMVGGAIIWYKPEWKIIDLICTLIFSVVVLLTTIKMLRDILEVLMESTPREIDATKLEKGLCEMDGVVAVHELHIWAITVGKVLLACHVTITRDSDADLVLDQVIGYIKREYNISHVTIQIEREEEAVSVVYHVGDIQRHATMECTLDLIKIQTKPIGSCEIPLDEDLNSIGSTYVWRLDLFQFDYLMLQTLFPEDYSLVFPLCLHTTGLNGT
ncbi:hypothetical protein OPV22_023558 [Ensete ventricosum]|uniref:Cation efflux protein cytoplasmic domain-containing protein n=1 Tax=Ensete ventricosum TaxID=4639 RepID=A0AAV8QMK0_ENSVE|nr:hypothetical protein OPV22_023558 [Ensete ventricosum]